MSTSAATRVTGQMNGFSLQRIWAELTGKCQLECVHCYAHSGPAGSHGTMTAADWMSLTDQAKALGAGIVQFIGGEPTMHPQFAAILRHALESGIEAEVYTNLVHVTDEVWDLLTMPGASLAFSYYSAHSAQHNAVTLRNSHAATRRNAERAVALGIPIRAGVIDVGAGQVANAREDLAALGITRIGVDRIRAIGRGGTDDISELCGRCGKGVAAIGPDGDVWPCVFSRWLRIGNVLTHALAEIIASKPMADAIASIPQGRRGACDPDLCDPDIQCSPGSPPSSCRPRT
jgi:MoaA/NifB/PqqE/SkfB family radical SAM enzyme